MPVARRRRSSRSNLLRLLLVLVAFVAVAAAALWLSLPNVRALAATNPPSTAMIDHRKEQAQAKKKPFRLHQSWRPLARISPYLQRAVVLAEDAQFWKHDGVDWEAMKLAAEHDWHERTLARGASTITQQVAKNLYLSPSRNPVRKLRELLIARRLDGELGKNRVLELYLNIAEWGDGVFGAEAAARRWFGCSAAELTPAQAARLAVALPNPFKRTPQVASPVLARRAARLVRGMVRGGLVSAEALAAAERELGVAAPPAASDGGGQLPAPPPPDELPDDDEVDPD